MTHHSQQVTSGGQATTLRDLDSVSGGMEQPAVVLQCHLEDRDHD